MTRFDLRSFAYGFLASGVLCLALFDDDFHYVEKEAALPFEEDLLEIPYGAPISQFKLQKEGYALAYSGERKIPIWVYEELSPNSLEVRADRDGMEFEVEQGLPEKMQAKLSDYYHSGYDRGHLAAAANHRNSPDTLRGTFTLSNIAPQNGEFNREIWAELEREIRKSVKRYEKVHLITGTLFYSEGKRLQIEQIGKNKIGVPTHFYKVILAEKEGGKVAASAYLFPNKKGLKGPLGKYQKSVAELEDLAGILFFPKLPQRVKKNPASLLGG